MTRQEAREMLAVIPSHERDTWVRVGMALRHAFGEDGWPLYEEWSMTWDGFDPRACHVAWRSFRPSGGITDRTLRWIASQHGYLPRKGSEKPDPKADAMAKSARQRMDKALADDHRRKSEDAALRAARMVDMASVRTHPYLASKGFPDLQGLVDADGNLLIPVRSAGEKNRILAVQSIAPDGSKRFLPRGCSVKHGVARIGYRASLGRVWLVEGWATGFSVHTALKRFCQSGLDEVRVCFSDGGLVRAAANMPPIRKSFVVADNDKSGAGERAAKKTGLKYWLPPELGDANDFHQRHGIDALADELWRFITMQQWGIENGSRTDRG